MFDIRAVANGVRTDHPIPGLAFVDDSHLPLDDPDGIEAIGRHEGEGSWGRTDSCSDGGWTAFTTDQVNPAFAWVVRFHPEHGTSVFVVHDDDASTVHMALIDPETALLYRAGGYWWDGITWYRPSQILDRASFEYLRRPVPAAHAVTAADLLADHSTGGGPARILTIRDLSSAAPGTPGADGPDDDGQDDDSAVGNQSTTAGQWVTGPWVRHLMAWARCRDQNDRPMDACVVNLTAPELGADQLVGIPEMAQIAGIAASTLRAYITREEGEVPAPQAVIGRRAAWSRAVAEEWAEQRRLELSSSGPGPDGLPTVSPGLAEVRKRFAATFQARLWDNPSRRKRWALRWRTEAAVREITAGLGADVASGLRDVVPVYDLAHTVRHALLHEFLVQQLQAREDGQEADMLGIVRPIRTLLTWLVRHYPEAARTAVADTIGQAEKDLGIPREVSAQAISVHLLNRDGREDAHIQEFLDKTLTPILANRPAK